MVCGRDTQKPRMGLSRSFSSVTCVEADKKLLVTQTLLKKKKKKKKSVLVWCGWLGGSILEPLTLVAGQKGDVDF